MHNKHPQKLNKSDLQDSSAVDLFRISRFTP